MPQTNLLLVDDSKSARFMIKKLIESKLDVKVDVAESGEEALEYLKDNKPDVIFMDHLMPGMDGLETTQVIKSQPETNAIPVVLCTSNDGPEHKKNAIEHGAIDLLPKPPNIDTITKILKSIEEGTTETLAGGDAVSDQNIDELVQTAVEKWLNSNLTELVNKAVEQKLATISLVTTDDVKTEIATLKTQMEKVLELKSEQAETNAEDLAKRLTASCQPSEDNLQPILNELLPNQLSPLKESITNLEQNLGAEATKAANAATQSISDTLSTQIAQEKETVNKQLEQLKGNFSNPTFIGQIVKLVNEQTKSLAVNVSNQVSTQVAEKTATSAIENSLNGPLADINKKVSGASSKALVFSIISAVVAIAVSIGASFVL